MFTYIQKSIDGIPFIFLLHPFYSLTCATWASSIPPPTVSLSGSDLTEESDFIWVSVVHRRLILAKPFLKIKFLTETNWSSK